MRRALIALLVGASVLVVGSSGPAQEPAPSVNQAFSYLPRDNFIVVALPTDFDGEAADTLDSRIVFPLLGDHAERALALTLRHELDFKGSYAREVAPQLGNELMVGLRSRIFVDGWGVVAALQVKDGAALLRTLRRVRGLRRDGTASGAHLFSERGSREAVLALDGDVLVFADSERRLRRALRRHDTGAGMTADLFERRLGDLPQDALIRAVADVQPLVESPPLRRFLRVRWVRALHGARGTIDVVGDHLQLDAALDSDPAATRPEDLPLQTGDQPPPVVRAPRRLSGASSNQSQATVFLLRAARAAFPRSRFVRDVARIERRLGINFEQEVLRQFDGPSASLLGLGGAFAARSAVRDPAELAGTMRRLRPHLGRLVEDLQSLETVGLSLLLLFAPDAPVTPVSTAAGHRSRRPRIKVRQLAGQRDFYRITGLCCDGPRTIYFGLEGNVFVIGSTEARAKAMADAPAAIPADAPGTSVTVAALETLRGGIRNLLWFDPGRLGEMRGFLNATVERLRGSLTIEFR